MVSITNRCGNCIPNTVRIVENNWMYRGFPHIRFFFLRNIALKNRKRNSHTYAIIIIGGHTTQFIIVRFSVAKISKSKMVFISSRKKKIIALYLLNEQVKYHNCTAQGNHGWFFCFVLHWFEVDFEINLCWIWTKIVLQSAVFHLSPIFTPKVRINLLIDLLAIKKIRQSVYLLTFIPNILIDLQMHPCLLSVTG